MLSFADGDGAFTQEVHLEKMSLQSAQAAGLNITKGNLEAACADPKAGNPRIRHNMTATITPDFDGLAGTFTVKGQPQSDMIPLTNAFGRSYFGEFEQLASSVDDGADWSSWVRVRHTLTGKQPDTKAPIFTPERENVRLKLIRSGGDETSDTAATSAAAVARAGTLAVGDLIIGPDTYVVVTTPLRNGDYEQADLSLRTY